jgi:integrase
LTHDALKEQRKLCDAFPARDTWENLVFKTSTGGPVDQARPTHALKRALRGAGLPQIRIHDLRHTAASALLTAGVHPKVVQEFLGHSSIKVTMDIYSHLMPTMHADAMKLLQTLLQDPAASGSDAEEPRRDAD